MLGRVAAGTAGAGGAAARAGPASRAGRLICVSLTELARPMRPTIRMSKFFGALWILALPLNAAPALKAGFATNQNTFPIAVWLQNPHNAAKFKAAGINLYVGLWRGPTDDQLKELEAAQMPVICGQNRSALDHRENPLIIGWMHGDEPDNAQSLGSGKGYGPPIKPEVIQADYEKIRATDPTRPVLLNLGQAVAWDNYIGRGVRRNHPEDYPEYVKGGDIISFDIYPVVHENKEVAGHRVTSPAESNGCAPGPPAARPFGTALSAPISATQVLSPRPIKFAPKFGCPSSTAHAA